MTTEPTSSFFSNLPAIISAAAQSTLGILALMIIALAVLAYIFFKGEGAKVKVAIFSMLFIGVAGFAAVVIRSANDQPKPKPIPGIVDQGPREDSSFTFRSGVDSIDYLFRNKMKEDNLFLSSVQHKCRIGIVCVLPGHYDHKRVSAGVYRYFYNPTNVKIIYDRDTVELEGISVPEMKKMSSPDKAAVEFRNNYWKFVKGNINPIYDAIKNVIKNRNGM